MSLQNAVNAVSTAIRLQSGMIEAIEGDDDEELELCDWVHHLERREELENKRKFHETRSKAAKRKVGVAAAMLPSQAALQALLRGGAVSAEPVLIRPPASILAVGGALVDADRDTGDGVTSLRT